MKKIYVRPEIEEIFLGRLMDQLPVESVGQKGSVTGQTDTGWEFGGDAEEGITPTAKGGNLWDSWDD